MSVSINFLKKNVKIRIKALEFVHFNPAVLLPLKLYPKEIIMTVYKDLAIKIHISQQ